MSEQMEREKKPVQKPLKGLGGTSDVYRDGFGMERPKLNTDLETKPGDDIKMPKIAKDDSLAEAKQRAVDKVPEPEHWTDKF